MGNVAFVSMMPSPLMAQIKAIHILVLEATCTAIVSHMVTDAYRRHAVHSALEYSDKSYSVLGFVFLIQFFGVVSADPILH